MMRSGNQYADSLDQFRNTYVNNDDRYKENKRDSYSVGNKGDQLREQLSYTETKKPNNGYKKSIYHKEMTRDVENNVFPAVRVEQPKPKFSESEEKFVSNYAKFYGVNPHHKAAPAVNTIDAKSKEALAKLLYDKNEVFFKYDILKNQKLSLMASDKKTRVRDVDINSKGYGDDLKRFWGVSVPRPMVTNLMNTNGVYGRLFN